MKKPVDRTDKWVVYLLRCANDALYCGITNDLEKRLAVHNAGRGAKFTRSRKPVALAGVSAKMTKSEALKLEYRIKQLPKLNKLAELKRREDPLKPELKKDLQGLQKEFKELGKKLDKLTKAVEKVLKAKPEKPAASKSKAGKPKSKVTKPKATTPKRSAKKVKSGR